MSKYPIDWPECKSHIRTRWAPASVIKLATSFAAIDSRPCVCDPGHLEANINKIASEASVFKMQDLATQPQSTAIWRLLMTSQFHPWFDTVIMQDLLCGLLVHSQSKG